MIESNALLAIVYLFVSAACVVLVVRLAGRVMTGYRSAKRPSGHFVGGSWAIALNLSLIVNCILFFAIVAILSGYVPVSEHQTLLLMIAFFMTLAIHLFLIAKTPKS